MLTPQQVAERLDAIPQSLRDFLFTSELEEAIGMVAEKYNLDDEKTFELTALVGETLMGFEKVDDFRKEIVSRKIALGSSADAIAAEIEQGIFKRAAPYLEQFLGERIIIGPPTFEGEKTSSPPVPGQPRVKVELPEIPSAVRKVPVAPLQAPPPVAEEKKEVKPSEPISFEWVSPSAPLPHPSTSPGQAPLINTGRDSLQEKKDLGGVIEISKAAEKAPPPEETEKGPLDLSHV